MIPVTKPFLPDKEEYLGLLDGIWERNQLTNHGPLTNILEQRLEQYLGVRRLLFLSSGTTALQIAIKALGLRGEIITTPFSHIATTGSIVWENCDPVFVDICEASLNMDASLIEGAITERTSAILATHVYGNPCDISAIGQIARKHRLRVIYDAAHCFGTKYKGKSVLEYGDISAISFHATKLFHTVEGGAVVTTDPALADKAATMRNFGQDAGGGISSLGINGKNSEFHAAMGIANLPHVDAILERRKRQYLHYQDRLQNAGLGFIQLNGEGRFNYAWLPVVFGSEGRLLEVLDALNARDVFPRRYFHPPLNQVGYVKGRHCPVCDDISSLVLALPLYHTLKFPEIDMICDILLDV